MSVKWIYELPIEVQCELRRDAYEILARVFDYELDDYELDTMVDDVMNEKLINVIGYADGMLSPDKYGKYLWK